MTAMLPFTQDQFFAVFAAYNEAFWPMPIVAYALGGVPSSSPCLRQRQRGGWYWSSLRCGGGRESPITASISGPSIPPPPAFTLAPSLGLPPELPGMMTADLHARQGWWGATAVATASGIALIVLPKRSVAKVAGAIVIAVPHLLGPRKVPLAGRCRPH